MFVDSTVRTNCDSLVALRALGAVRTTSSLVRQCQEALNDISALHAVGLYWVPGHMGVRGNEMADRLCLRVRGATAGLRGLLAGT
jgi:ribonuclease HI